MGTSSLSGNLPPWLKKSLPAGRGLFEVKESLCRLRVNTVCESSLCPNLNECFSKKFATFLILGRACTRSCGFCSVKKGGPEKVDPDEPARIAAAVRRLGLRYVTITSVTRDDLADGGAGQFVMAVKALKNQGSDIIVEVLVPDFRGDRMPLELIGGSGPDVFGHNIETVERLYPVARQGADYSRSLGLLKAANDVSPGWVVKSGMMVGLGESEDEVIATMRDIAAAGCSVLTIGQYLRPARENLPVVRFVSPDEFERYREIGKAMGFARVVAGPFVRSSYLAEEIYKEIAEGSNDKGYITAVGGGR